MGVWENPFVLEMQVAHLISDQSLWGCNFNSRQASWHAASLSEKIVNVDIKLIPLLPMMMNKGNTFLRPFKISGQLQKWPQKYCDEHGLTREQIGGPFTRVWWTPFDPGKVAKVKEVMLDNGWVPSEWNTKKQEFDARGLSKKLRKRSYRRFLATLPVEDQVACEELLEPFMEKHFSGKSRGYMKAILRGMGFPKGAVPDRGEIKKRLLRSQYWITSPKINIDIDTWEGGNSDLGDLLCTRMKYSHRRSLLQGLLKVVRPDGKIPAEANTCATPTARFTHRKVVNIPAGRALYGKECRSLFVSDKNEGSKAFMLDTGKKRIFIPENRDIFVGGDASGLELRVLTHYLIAVCDMLLRDAQKGHRKADVHRFSAALKSAYKYRETLLEGDIHLHNQKLAGLPTRDAAKSFIYAFNYGAGNAKLGSLVGGGAKEGEQMRARFLKECPCISVLIEWAKQTAEQGWLPALDGRKLMMRRDENGNVQTHKSLNTLLQAGGSIVVKKATLILDQLNKGGSVDCHQVIHMH